MKYLAIVILLVFLCSFLNKTYAIYDPTIIPNNKYGIHILFTSELSEAAHLVNSTGGDWGYVTIPIQSSDRNIKKWQLFMDDCQRFHVIPILRIATDADYFNKSSWSKPNNYDILDFANFLNDLNWPTKNRYVIIFNEVNRGDEWGGQPNANEYAEILSYAVDAFKNLNSDFFIISAGLDNASANINFQSIENLNYLKQMEIAVPGIFSKIDGISSHSYPNPAFSKPPSYLKMGVNSYYFEKKLVDNYANKSLPVFITETGWSSDRVTQDLQSKYYLNTFSQIWNNNDIIAVTPFIFNAQNGAFKQFSFFNSSGKNKIYFTYFNLLKNKGEPELSPESTNSSELINPKTIGNFKFEPLLNIFKSFQEPQKIFLKWIFKI